MEGRGGWDVFPPPIYSSPLSGRLPCHSSRACIGVNINPVVPKPFCSASLLRIKFFSAPLTHCHPHHANTQRFSFEILSEEPAHSIKHEQQISTTSKTPLVGAPPCTHKSVKPNHKIKLKTPLAVIIAPLLLHVSFSKYLIFSYYVL